MSKINWFNVCVAITVVLVVIAIVLAFSPKRGAALSPAQDADLSSLITDPCIVDGTPRILSFNNYGDTVNKKTIMYQRDNGDIVVLYIDGDYLGRPWVWAVDKISGGVCAGS